MLGLPTQKNENLSTWEHPFDIIQGGSQNVKIGTRQIVPIEERETKKHFLNVLESFARKRFEESFVRM